MPAKRAPVGRPAARASTPAAGAARRYWLVKSEPESFAFEDLMRAPRRTTGWDGVRNYQARNYMRDDMRVGDGVLYYHSNANPPAIVGLAEVARAAYPDPTQFDPGSDYHDPRATADAPIWMQVDVRGTQALPEPLPLERLRTVKALAGMELLRKGSRLSVQPVTAAEWAAVLRLAGVKA